MHAQAPREAARHLRPPASAWVGHLRLHRHRGLDAPAAPARRRLRRRARAAPRHAAGGVGAPRRRRGQAPRATPSSSPSPRRRRRRRRRRRPGALAADAWPDGSTAASADGHAHRRRLRPRRRLHRPRRASGRRVVDAAHGGQVLVSSRRRARRGRLPRRGRRCATSAITGSRTSTGPSGCTSSSIGRACRRVPAAAPAAPAAGASALPAPPNRTIGRDARAARDRRAAARRPGRLLTLTGPGGVGQDAAGARGRARGRGRTSPTARGSSSLAPLDRPRTSRGAIVAALAIVRSRASRPSESGRALPGASSTCCWSSTTASTCRRRAVHRRAARGVPRRSRCWPPAASRCAVQAEQRYPVPPLALPSRHARTALADVAPSRCSASARGRTTRLRARRRQRRRGGGDLPAARRAAAGDRAGRRPLRRCSHPARSPHASTRRSALGAAPRDAPARQQTLRATIDWSHDLLERRREGVLRALRGVRRRRHGRGGRGDHRRRPRHARPAGRQEPARAPPHAGRADPAGDARDDPRVRRRALRGRCRRAKPCASATSRYFLALAQRHGTDPALWGAEREEHLARSTPRSRTSTRPSRGRSAGSAERALS